MTEKERKFVMEFFRGYYNNRNGIKEPFIMYTTGRDNSGKVLGNILDYYGTAFFEGFINNQIINFEKKYSLESGGVKVPIKYILKKTNTGIYYGRYSFEDDFIGEKRKFSGNVIIRKINLKKEAKKTIKKDLEFLSEMSSFPKELFDYLIKRKRKIYNFGCKHNHNQIR